MGIDQRCTNGDAGSEAEIGSGFGGETAAERRGDIDDLVADADETLLGELLKADTVEITWIPPPFMGEVSPFAGHGAGRAIARSGGPPTQIIGKIEEVSGCGKDCGPVLLEP